MSEKRYKRPDLQPQTVKDIKMLRFLIGEIPPPQGGEDAWLWEEARTYLGKPMHRLLLAVAKAGMNEDENLRIAGADGLLGSFTKARSEVFQAICERALKRGDAEFFRHLADCIEAIKTPRKSKAAEPFKALVLAAYKLAQIEAVKRAMPKNPKNFSAEFGAMMKITVPDWQDIRDEMDKRGSLPPDFKNRDLDNQRRQIERALKSLGLPYANKRQG